MIYSHALDTVGNTPLVQIRGIFQQNGIEIFAKLEGTNPGGSVKDRIAKRMIENAEEKGILKKGVTIIEATSGNTGIGLAMAAALKGYRFIAVMAEDVSSERKTLLKSFGTEMIFTPKSSGTNGAITHTAGLVKSNKNLLWINQFENQDNPDAHYFGTGAEIAQELNRIDYFVVGMGTGGTVMGAGKYLKERFPNVKIIGIQPKPGENIAGLRRMDVYVPPIFNPGFLDGIIEVTQKEALEWMKLLIKKEGLAAGVSSGAALWGAAQLAQKSTKATIVTLFPDRSDRYLSTAAFDMLK